MEIKEKNKEKAFDIGKTEATGDKLELLKYLSEVQSRIKTDVSSDFVLAKLEEQDKIGITEMTCNAYFCKRIHNILERKGYKWEWNGKNYEKRNLNLEELKTIGMFGQITFDAFMNKIYMTAILNRNIDKNYLVGILGQVNQEIEEEAQEEEKQEGILKKIGKALKRKGKKEEQNGEQN